MDGWWTSCGRAGAAEIAWEEARDGGARLKGMIRWTGGGRAVDCRVVAGLRRGKPVKSRVADFSKKKGTLLLGFSGCGKKQVMYGM